MERETWIRAGMVLTILGLLGLVLVTPSLMGRPPELASLPLLIVGVTEDVSTFILDVSAAVQAYMYANMTLEVEGLDNVTYVAVVNEADTYDVHLRIPTAVTSHFHVHAVLFDRQDNYFEYNLTVRLGDLEDRGIPMIFSFPDEQDAPEVVRFPPDDFRWLIPRRGTR